MTEGRLFRFLSKFADLRPGEGKISFLLFWYFFLITFPAYIIKPLKLSLFLVNFHPRFQPFAYLLSATLIGFVAALNSKLLKKMARKRYISLTIVFFIVGFLVFWVLWVLFRIDWNGLSLIYWTWSDIFIATSVVQFWICVNDAFHPHQAKRLVGFFVTGGLLGGIGGSLLAWQLARTIGTENLLLACPLILLATLVIVNALYKTLPGDEGRTPEKSDTRILDGFLDGFRLMRTNRYLLLLAALLCAGAVAGNLIEFQFNTILSWRFINKDPRTAFLGSFYAALLILSFFLQLFGTSRILKKFGLRVSLLITPVLLLAGSAAIFLIPTAFLIFWAVLVRGTDKSLENTLSQSVREILYIPIVPDIKYKAKMFIDLFLNKFSTAVGAIFFLIFYTILRVRIVQISFLVAIFLVLWIFLIRVVSKEYLNVVKKDLTRKWEDGDKIVAENVDVGAARLIFDTIQSREKSSVLYAMNLFDLIRKEKLTPELKQVLDDKSGELRARSMDALLDAGGEVLFPGVEDVLADKGFIDEVKEVMELESYRNLIGEHMEGAGEHGKKTVVERMEDAKILGMMKPEPWVVRQLSRLLEDESSDVLHYALESSAEIKSKELLPLIIKQLGNPHNSQVAQSTLAAYGSSILGILKRILSDENEDPSVTRALPEVLARMGTQKAADTLLAELLKGRKEFDKEIIEALYKIRAGNQNLGFKEAKVIPVIFKQIQIIYEVLLAGEAESCLPLDVKPLFDLLSLIRPVEDIVKAYQNLCQGARKSIDYSLELLDNLLPKNLAEYLLPLVEDLSLEERIRRCRRLLAGLEKMNRKSRLERKASPSVE